MSLIAKIARLSQADRLLILQAFTAVAAARLALLVLPLSIVRRMVRGTVRAGVVLRASDRRPVERIVWAVSSASKRSPVGTTCLASALAGQALLDRNGYCTRLRIGVKRDASGAFAAHAWVEYEGRPILGGPLDSIGSYTAMPEWEHLIV